MANVGEKTGKKTQAGRDVYKTPEGEMVSEKSTTFEYKGKWINIPTIHGGKQYSQDQLINMLDKGLIKPTSTHNKLEEAVKAAKSRSKSLKFNEGGLADQMDSMLPAVDDDTRSTEEYLKDTKPMDISSVPAFKRPLDASENDKPTGNIDETGAIEYRTALGNTYLVRRNPDQRTTRTKIQEDVLPAVENWLQNPKAPSQEQILNIGKGIAESVYDLVSIPGDLATGKKSASDITLGDVYDTTGMMAVGSAAFGVPEGALRTFGGSGMELDSGELSNFKKARELMKAEISNIDPSQYDQFYWANKKVWNATGWYINPSDKQWRYEINDKKSKIDWNNANISDVTGSELKEHFENLPITKPDNDNGIFSTLGKKARTLKLSDFFTHDNLYKRYPFLKDLDTEFYNEKDNTLGSFTPGTNLIKINVGAMKSLDQNDPRFRSTLLHEIQHAIQYHEGFSHGANSAYIPSEVTKDLLEKSEAIKSEAKNNIRKNAVDLSVKHGFNNLYDYFPLPSDLDKLGKKTYYDLLDDDEARLLEETGIQAGSELYNLITDTVNQYRKYVDGDEITKNMEFKFYLGADGEIESRLVQATLEDSAYQGTYPIDRANKMLNERDPDRYDEFVNTPEFRGKVGEGDPRVRTPDIGEADVFITPEKSFVDFLPEIDPNKPGYNMEFTTKDEIKAKTEFVKQLFKGQPKLKKLFNIKPGQKFTLNYEDGPLEVEFRHYSFQNMDKKNLRGEGSIIISSDYDKLTVPTAVIKYPEGNNRQISIMELINRSSLVKDFDIQDLRNTQKSSSGFFSGIRNKLGFAKGGAVNNMSMKQQMSLFEYGGIADDGMTKDPVSGNNIPPGSLAKEVRDDIPAMLSEGEYVVPADVLRYYGVNFFENLRGQAKQGLQSMEQNGRIGGTPMTQQDVARNMQQPMMAPAPVQAAQGAMMQSPMRIQQQPAPQAMGNAIPQQQPIMANRGTMVQGFDQGTADPRPNQYRSGWSPARARYNTPMFQGTSSQQANIAAAQEAEQDQAATEEITQFRKHYNQAGESVQIKYTGTSPDNMSVAPGQEDLLSQYPLTEEEWLAYKKEMSRGSGGDDGGGEDPVSSGSDVGFLEGIDYTDQAKVQAWADERLGLSKDEQFGTKMGGLLFGGASAISQARDIAEVRAMAEIQRAAGNTEFADKLDAEADKAVESGTDIISAFDKLGFMTGDQLAKQGMKIVGTTIQMQNAMRGAGTDSATMTSPGLSGDTAESRAEIAKEQELMSQQVKKPNSGDDDSLTHEEIMEMHYGTDWSDTQTAAQRQASEEATGGIGSETGGWTPPGFDFDKKAKGGLMTAPKPKKKTRKYNKGGLAGKKK